MTKPLTPQSMGRRGGLAKAASTTPEQRRANALKAASARWANHGKPSVVPVAATVQMMREGLWRAQIAGRDDQSAYGTTRNEAVSALARQVAAYWAGQIEARIVSLACDGPSSATSEVA